jgi:hypothetical protein
MIGMRRLGVRVMMMIIREKLMARGGYTVKKLLK